MMSPNSSRKLSLRPPIPSSLLTRKEPVRLNAPEEQLQCVSNPIRGSWWSARLLETFICGVAHVTLQTLSPLFRLAPAISWQHIINISQRQGPRNALISRLSSPCFSFCVGFSFPDSYRHSCLGKPKPMHCGTVARVSLPRCGIVCEFFWRFVLFSSIFVS
jgi:hypothetical protein